MAIDAATLKTYLIDLSPVFETVDEARVGRLAAIASTQVKEKVWGASLDYALTLYVAHMITAGEQQGKGAVTSEEIGDIKRTYSAPSSGVAANGLDSTIWGTLYKELGATRLRGPLVT